MIRLNVKIEDVAAKSGIAAIIAASQDRSAIHEAAAIGVAGGVKVHLRALNRRSPNTNYYAKAAETVEHTWNESGADINISHIGLRIRLEGGTITAGKGISTWSGKPTKFLALPTDKVPVRNEMRLRPKDAGILAFIPNSRGSIHTGGFLVEGIQKLITRGPNKGKNRAVPKPGGDLLYILRKMTVHTADPTIMPGIAELMDLAGEAVADYVDSFDERGIA